MTAASKPKAVLSTALMAKIWTRVVDVSSEQTMRDNVDFTHDGENRVNVQHRPHTLPEARAIIDSAALRLKKTPPTVTLSTLPTPSIAPQRAGYRQNNLFGNTKPVDDRAAVVPVPRIERRGPK